MQQSPNRRLICLLLTGTAAALIYSAALLQFPLLTNYAVRLYNLNKITGSDTNIGIVLAISIVLLFSAYALGAAALWNIQAGKFGPEPLRDDARALQWILPRLVLVGFPLIFFGLLLLVYPTTSLDLYDYLFRGRMLARYQANTFVQTPQDFAGDPLFGYVAWKRALTAYGPLWEGMSWLTARLAGQTPGSTSTDVLKDGELLRLLLAYKLLGALGFLLCGAAIWLALGRLAPERRDLGVYLWLWNPLVLWESIAAGHNDAWMALLIVLAVWAFSAGPGDHERETIISRRRKRDRWMAPGDAPSQPLISRAIGAFLVLTAGGLIKFLALFLGPVLLSAALRRLDTWSKRKRLIMLGGALCAALVVLAYAPFWSGWRTLRNFGERSELFTASWLAAFQALAETIAHQHFGVDAEVAKRQSQTTAAAIGLGLLLFGVLWSAVRAWKAPGNIAAHTLWLLLWFLFFCNPWFQPWYLLWAVALVALQPARGRAAAGIGLFCCTAMLSYVAGSFLLPALDWNDKSAQWNALVSALIYGPPLLVLGLGNHSRIATLHRLPRALIARRQRGAIRP